MDISIIIPAYNEERCVKATLASIDDFFKRQSLVWEILVVDDGSADQTGSLVCDYQKTNPRVSLISIARNRGKGYAVRAGVENASSQCVLIVDADNSTPIEEFDKLFEALQKGYAIAIGSRALPESVICVKQPFYRIWIGRAGNLLVRLMLRLPIKDTQCGFKLFHANAARDIFARQRIHRWGFDMEALAMASMLGYSIAEIPVLWRHSSDTRVRAVRDALRTFFELCAIKWNLETDAYAKTSASPTIAKIRRVGQ